MNAARKALVADLRMRGMTGKQAYEATKPACVPKAPENKPAEKTSNPTWVTRHLERKLENQIVNEVKRIERLRLKQAKDQFISSRISEHGAIGALSLWEQELERMKLEAEQKAAANVTDQSPESAGPQA